MESPTEPQIKYAKNLGIENPEQFSKAGLKDMIAMKVDNKSSQAPVSAPFVKPSVVNTDENTYKTTDKFTTMYVSYAKDLFVELVQHGGNLNNPSPVGEVDIMEVAIKLIKQARDAFS